MITPIDIRKKKFKKKWRGYHPKEVTHFLHMLSEAWKKILIENNQLQETIKKKQITIEKLQAIENKLLYAIQNIEATQNQMIGQAKKEASLILQQAKIDEEKIRQETAQYRDQSKDKIDQEMQHMREATKRYALVYAETKEKIKYLAKSMLDNLEKNETLSSIIGNDHDKDKS